MTHDTGGVFRTSNRFPTARERHFSRLPVKIQVELNREAGKTDEQVCR
jgi:hypothetical protein